MGFFDFLKKKGPETIGFSQIAGWLDKQVADKKLNQRVARTKEIVTAKILESHRFLEELEKAGLQNPNIPLKAKQIMEGHRKTYISRMKRFLDEIEVPDDFSQIGYYSANFSESLTKLSEETQKNYLVLKEFMEAELAKVIKSVKAIEDELVKLQADIEKEGIELIGDAKVKLKQYQDDLKRKAMLEEERAKQTKEVESLKERRHKMAARLEELHKTPDYNEFKELLENKKKYEEKLQEIERDLKTIFAELNRPLRKFKHASLQEKLIDKYLLDPVGALEDDASFVMLEVLGKMSRELERLDLKEAQLSKAMDMINRMNRDFFLNKKLELDQIKEVNKETATKINKSVVALNIGEADTLLRGMAERISEAEKSLEDLTKALDEINLDYLKQKVKEKIKEISSTIIVNDD